MSSRTANFTVKEKHTLLNLIGQYKNIIENKGTSASIIARKNEAWQKIREEFNAETETARTVKHLRLLYSNLKRKTRKDVAEEHEEQYLRARICAEEDSCQINKTGGGSYNPPLLDESSAQILAIVGDQITPLQNDFDDAVDFFRASPMESEIPVFPGSSKPYPTPEPVQMTKSSVPNPRPRKLKQSINYKQLYFKKKYQTACFEMKSKKILHDLEVKIKKRQLENLK